MHLTLYTNIYSQKSPNLDPVLQLAVYWYTEAQSPVDSSELSTSSIESPQCLHKDLGMYTMYLDCCW